MFWGKKIGDITNIDELYRALSKRTHWKKLPAGILQEIFSNAKGDIKRINQLRIVSERYDLVEKNFLPLTKSDTAPLGILPLFAVTLNSLGTEIVATLDTLARDSVEWDMNFRLAHMAFLSSVLCNPLMLPTYASLITLTLSVGAIGSVQLYLQDYEQAERILMQSPDEVLGFYNRSLKEGAPEIRATLSIDDIKAQIGLT
jgi:hypothetical protein